MGVDIYTSSGILFPIEEAVGRFFKVKKSEIASVIEEITPQIPEEKKEFAETLKNVKTSEELGSWFCGLVNAFINDEYIGYSDDLARIFDSVLDHTKFAGLPETSLDYFTSGRYSGYDVPIETPCVIFNDNGLFETKLTKEGQAVAKKMGMKIAQTTWTVYSY